MISNPIIFQLTREKLSNYVKPKLSILNDKYSIGKVATHLVGNRSTHYFLTVTDHLLSGSPPASIQTCITHRSVFTLPCSHSQLPTPPTTSEKIVSSIEMTAISSTSSYKRIYFLISSNLS